MVHHPDGPDNVEELARDADSPAGHSGDQPAALVGGERQTSIAPSQNDDHEQADELTTIHGAISPELLDEVQTAIEDHNAERLEECIEDLHHADLAELLALLSNDQREAMLGMVSAALPAEALAELDDDVRDSVLTMLPAEQVAEAVAELDTDDAAYLIEDLDDKQRDEILAEVPVADRLAVRAALEFEEDSAGRLMQREFFAAPSYWTVGQIIDCLRNTQDLPDLFYEVFVVDPSFRPIGGVPLSTLLKEGRDTVIEDLMGPAEDLRRIPLSMDQEEVAYLFEHYNLISAPVVDDAERLVGMITVDDVVEMVREETQEDMLALAGVEADTGLSDTVMTTVRSRFSWLAINLCTAIMASIVIGFFDGAIGQMVALAVLMPIVASMGGNAGTQTLTVAVRSLATKDLTPANAARIIWREVLVGGVNGVLFALIIGVVAALWFVGVGWGTMDEGVRLGLVVGSAMIINLLAAGMAGILVPLALQRAGADPAVSSAVFVTTVTDIVGFLAFLGLAAIVLLPV